jgi:hypothetical protein
LDKNVVRQVTAKNRYARAQTMARRQARLQVDEIDEHTAAIGCRDGEPQADNGI